MISYNIRFLIMKHLPLFYTIRMLIFECHRKRNKCGTENNYLFMLIREIAFIYNTTRIVRSGNRILTSFFVTAVQYVSL